MFHFKILAYALHTHRKTWNCMYKNSYRPSHHYIIPGRNLYHHWTMNNSPFPLFLDSWRNGNKRVSPIFLKTERDLLWTLPTQLSYNIYIFYFIIIIIKRRIFAMIFPWYAFRYTFTGCDHLFVFLCICTKRRGDY